MKLFLKDDRGTEAVEYMAVVAFIALPMLVALLKVSQFILNIFKDAWNDLANG